MKLKTDGSLILGRSDIIALWSCAPNPPRLQLRSYPAPCLGSKSSCRAGCIHLLLCAWIPVCQACGHAQRCWCCEQRSIQCRRRPLREMQRKDAILRLRCTPRNSRHGSHDWSRRTRVLNVESPSAVVNHFKHSFAVLVGIKMEEKIDRHSFRPCLSHR